MKSFLIFLTTLLSFRVVNSYKCDKAIVECIQKLWEKHGNDCQGGLLKELDESGYVIVVAGTTGLLPDEDLIDRLGARFSGNTVQNVELYKNGTKIISPEFQVQDVNGRDFYTEELQRHRYYLPYDTTKAVTGFYLCEDSGVSGNPRGNIVIFSENYDENAVTDVKESLASVGIDITKTYPDTFPSLI